MINRTHLGKDDTGYIKHLFHSLFIVSSALVNLKKSVYSGLDSNLCPIRI